MAQQDETGGGPIGTLYGVTIRASIQRGDLADLKAVLAQAEALNKQQGDIRGAVAIARAALAKSPSR